MHIYVVKPGDNVDGIASMFGIPVDTLLFDNQISYPYRLAVGQALFIPGGDTEENVGGIAGGSVGGAADEETGGPRPSLTASGYAYPFISVSVLESTLPWLTAINVFSYGFTAEGSLVMPMSDDGWVIDAARASCVRPALTLTPLGADGHFNNNLVTALVENPAVQRRLLLELGMIMQEKGYEGLDIDFEYVRADDRLGFVEFVRLAVQMMNLLGYPVTVALAPKTSRDQPGLLYEGIDYRLLGEAADRVMLMTYEWGYSQGPPMAVAPLNMVRRVVDYAVSEIAPEKILLGIPNYGYDWPLPYVRGVTRAPTIGVLDAVQLAIDHGVDIRFDETAQSPYFRYWQYGVQHEVWFEDARSLRAKFDLVKEYGLAGIGYWQLMRFFRAGWLMLDELFELERGCGNQDG